jgi:predicted carbohydrate-binding protein with CBM5 and CBM33 domain
MMKQFTPALAFASMISMVNAHGFVTSPQARMPGSAMAAACGNQVQVNQESDNYGNIQGELQVASSQSDYKAADCDIWLCKGYKFADNKDNVQSYTAGQKVPFTVDIRAPHTGVANVSVVDTSSNSVIGNPLISWDVYASTATGVTSDETSFSVTIPEDLGSQCATAGDCVLQWYWYAESIDQTYESCVDFTLGGDSSSSSSGSSSSAVVSSAAATSATAVAVSTSSTSTEAPASTTSAAISISTSVTAPVAAQTTFATSARQSASPSAVATPSAAGSDLPFSTDSASDVLSWIESLLTTLVGSN